MRPGIRSRSLVPLVALAALVMPATAALAAGEPVIVAAPGYGTAIVGNLGSVAGGTTVSINGQGFTGATAVDFGVCPAASFTVLSDTKIEAVTGACLPGTTNVSVTTPLGTSTEPGVAVANDFTFVPLGASTQISGVVPNTGPVAGGGQVEILGLCFTGATQVLFGDTPATSFTVNSDTKITAVAPAGAPGADVDVTVVSPCGTSPEPLIEAVNDFLFGSGIPVISDLSETVGLTSGGETVMLTGSGFTGATGVDFGSCRAASFSVLSDTQIAAVTAPCTPGTVDVRVTTPFGTSATFGDDFTFLAPGVTGVGDVEPDSGPIAGGTTVDISGVCFTGATQVLFRDNPAASFTVVSDTHITAVSPTGTAGVAEVVVVSPCGTSATDGSANDFTYAGLAAGTFVCDANAYDDPFTDIAGNFAEDEITCLWGWGITSGTTATTYGPTQSNTRDQMAVFLIRTFERATGAAYTGSQENPFTDITGNFAEQRIGQAYRLRFTTGTSATTYAPLAPVTREQMAVFLIRVYEGLTGETVPSPQSAFTDIANSFARTQIEQLVHLGITAGTTPTTFSPANVLSRDQMAVFLVRLLEAASR